MEREDNRRNVCFTGKFHKPLSSVHNLSEEGEQKFVNGINFSSI